MYGVFDSVMFFEVLLTESYSTYSTKKSKSVYYVWMKFFKVNVRGLLEIDTEKTVYLKGTIHKISAITNIIKEQLQPFSYHYLSL